MSQSGFEMFSNVAGMVIVIADVIFFYALWNIFCKNKKEKMKIARGILICGTGIGVSIAANKVPGAYAALVNNVYQAQRAQLSNNANIITLGAQVTGIELAKCLVKEYLSVTFDPESRSMPKVARITEYEKEGK